MRMFERLIILFAQRRMLIIRSVSFGEKKKLSEGVRMATVLDEAREWVLRKQERQKLAFMEIKCLRRCAV